MSGTGSVTGWIPGVKAGDDQAAQKLWETYFHRLMGLARKKLRGRKLRQADEEDAVLSALDSFCRAAEQGKFPQLTDRNDLWRLLVVLTARKVADLVAVEDRQKRGGAKLQGESGIHGGIHAVIDHEPTPEFAAQVAEECERLLGLLDDDQLREVALWKMEGWTNEEIAQQLKCSLASVERKLRYIRRCWKDAYPGFAEE